MRQVFDLVPTLERGNAAGTQSVPLRASTIERSPFDLHSNGDRWNELAWQNLSDTLLITSSQKFLEHVFDEE